MTGPQFPAQSFDLFMGLAQLAFQPVDLSLVAAFRIVIYSPKDTHCITSLMTGSLALGWAPTNSGVVVTPLCGAIKLYASTAVSR
jgi:hypothetical protein